MNAGLYNEGATCYANSVIQCLSRNKDFPSGIFNFFGLFQRLYNLKGDIKIGETNKELLNIIFNNEGIYTQQDAQEFLNSILSLNVIVDESGNIIKDEKGNIQFFISPINSDLESYIISNGRKINIKGKVIYDKWNNPIYIKQKKKNIYLAPIIKFGDDSFYIEIETELSRKQKDKDKETRPSAKEILNILSLNVKDYLDKLLGSSVKELLNNFFTDEAIEAKWDESSKEVEKLTKKKIVSKTPETLIIQLKIFKMNFTTNPPVGEKINISKDFEIDEFIYDPEKKMFYSLESIILHSGATINAGHYISIIKQNNQFYIYNDSIVSGPMSLKKALGETQKNGFDAYILFYKKESKGDIKRKIDAAKKKGPKVEKKGKQIKIVKKPEIEYKLDDDISIFERKRIITSQDTIGILKTRGINTVEDLIKRFKSLESNSQMFGTLGYIQICKAYALTKGLLKK
ncbi:hypothetical protein GF385_03895 [Candidatus Dependentiae bacterium]|nr:hypothetical protein [Candidatus Dependentiae bacterium]